MEQREDLNQLPPREAFLGFYNIHLKNGDPNDQIYNQTMAILQKKGAMPIFEAASQNFQQSRKGTPARIIAVEQLINTLTPVIIQLRQEGYSIEQITTSQNQP